MKRMKRMKMVMTAAEKKGYVSDCHSVHTAQRTARTHSERKSESETMFISQSSAIFVHQSPIIILHVATLHDSKQAPTVDYYVRVWTWAQFRLLCTHSIHWLYYFVSNAWLLLLLFAIFFSHFSTVYFPFRVDICNTPLYLQFYSFVFISFGYLFISSCFVLIHSFFFCSSDFFKRCNAILLSVSVIWLFIGGVCVCVELFFACIFQFASLLNQANFLLANVYGWGVVVSANMYTIRNQSIGNV